MIEPPLHYTDAVERSDMDGRGSPSDAPVVRYLLATGLAVALVRWLFAADGRIFHVYFDEPGQFAIARWLAGGQRWSLFDLDTWQPGYAMLVAPLYVVSDDVTTVYRLTMGLNALLAGVSAVLLVLLTHRLTNLDGRVCCGIAGVVALLPASLSSSAAAWSEPLVSMLLLGAAVAVLRFLDAPNLRVGAFSILLAVAAAFTHGRLLPLVVVVAALVVGGEGRTGRWSTAMLLAVFAVVAQTVSMTAAWIVQSRVWDEPADENTVRSTLARLEEPSLVVGSAVGQVWYQLVATALVFGIGITVLITRAINGRDHPGLRRSADRRDALVIMAMIVPLVLVSMLFMARTGRSDFRIYGRYNDSVVWPVLAVGLAWLWQAHNHSRRHVLAMVGGWVLALAGLTAFVDIRHGPDLADDRGVEEMIAGVVPLLPSGRVFDPVLAAAVAGSIIVLLVAVRRLQTVWSNAMFVGVVIVVLLTGGIRTSNELRNEVNRFESAAEVRAVRQLVPGDTTIGYKFVPVDQPSFVSFPAQRRAALLYQAYLPDYRFERDKGLDDDVGPYVFAPRLDPTLTDAGAIALWEAQDSGMTLWLEPVSP